MLDNFQLHELSGYTGLERINYLLEILISSKTYYDYVLNSYEQKDYEKNQDEFIKYVYDKTREGEHETNEFEKMLNNMNERLGINRGTVEENNTHKTTK